MIDLNTLDDIDLARLIADAYREQQRRRVIAEAPARADQAAREYLTASGRDPGDPWQAPSGAHDAFPEGWLVEHDGKTWESVSRRRPGCRRARSRGRARTDSDGTRPVRRRWRAPSPRTTSAPRDPAC